MFKIFTYTVWISVLSTFMPFAVYATGSGNQANMNAAANQIDGKQVFETHCKMCHTGFLGSKAPSPDALAKFPASSIIHSLTVGVMRAKGNQLSGAERRAVADYLSSTTEPAGEQQGRKGYCGAEHKVESDIAATEYGWNGWGNSIQNGSFQSAKAGGITSDNVGDLTLKWAFGYADSYSAWSQPVVAKGRLFVGSQAGKMTALDAESGCILWQFEAKAGVRSAVNVGHYQHDDTVIDAIYFGDQQGNVYGLNANTGAPLWSLDLETHPKGRVTGSPVLHNNTLYVPMSSWRTVEEPGSSCCTFRGSVSAIDVNSAKVIWKSYTIPTTPALTGETDRLGNPLKGPAGSSVWQALTIDEKRHVLYAGTGNSYTAPAVNSDSILAFDLDTGEIRWQKQVLAQDVWVPGCKKNDAECVFNAGHNFDFSTAPVLVRTETGNDLIVAGNKSGLVYALDPDRDGAVVWHFRAAQGGDAGGIVWGLATDKQNAYVPVSDITAPKPGGIYALELATGKPVWHAQPVSPLLCGTPRYGCNAAQPAGIALLPGILFAGSVDGGIRAYSSSTGEILWVFDTNQSFHTVNGVEATGGSLIGAGPSVVNGMLYVNSGYGTNGGRPGNVLLAFGVK